MGKLNQIKTYLQKNNLDGMIVTSPINRRYLTGFTGSAGIVIISQSDQLLLTDFRYTEQAKEQVKDYTIVTHEASIFQEVADQLKQLNLNNMAFEAAHISYEQYEQLNSLISAQLIPVTNVIETIRSIKTTTEWDIMKKAAEIADRAYEHILSFIKPGMQEIEVANELEFFMRQAGATSASFDIIVASGWRSALPHGVASEKVIETGELVTMDFGALYKGYCSDITRTVAIGPIDETLKEIYDIVLKAQTLALSKIKPGMTGQEADAFARDVIDEAGYGNYFGHSTGHGLGMEVHEQPRLSTQSETKLQPGMVVTVEPGIYIPNVGGCRIEDDIIITETGNERLTLSTKQLMYL